MRKIRLIALSAVVIAFFGINIACAQEVHAQAVVPGEFVYSLRPGKSVVDLLNALSKRKLKAELLGFSPATRTALVKFEGVGTPEQVNATLQSTEDIDDVIARSPNIVYSLTNGPNDPLVQKSTYFQQVNAPIGWEHVSSGSSVLVAVLDTGILLEHEDIKKNLWTNPTPGKGVKVTPTSGPVGDIHGWNFVDNNSNVNPKDANERHGTNVAGIIAAVGNNAIGSAGIAWKSDVKIMPVRMCSTDCKLFNAISAVNYAVDHGARIINMSWGGPVVDDQLMLALDSARKKNVLIVAAAGNGDSAGLGQNNDTNPFYPASYNLDNIISVAAVNNSDALASYSNYGKNSVHIAAPGNEIIGPVPIAGKDARLTSGYRAMTGTSQAAPVIAGTAAVLIARHPNLTPARVREIIMQTGDHQPALAERLVSGARVNVDKAISQSDSAQLAAVEGTPVTQPVDVLALLATKKKQQFGDVSKLLRAPDPLPLPTTYAWASGGKKEVKDMPAKLEFVITFEQGMNIDAIKKALPQASTTQVGYATNQAKVVVESAKSEVEVLKALKNISGVENVSPNSTYQLQKARN